ncbi:F-box protein At5g07610-like [Papaver somniferum]|uniref:F-box protein At5g07610-like n=1 Tax=Papaver somniferum TaxID=3469 RepID=UPI000E6FFFD5|nr:F-box protein At5g07610-like [Papaver somniferum]XP_026420921.1 F-box protein At5g07610-like [Papaver somniferum]
MASLSRKVRPKPKRAKTSAGDSGNTLTAPNSSLVVGNDDLLTHILVRLPVKNLIRSKLVSKKWFSIISDPKLVRTYSVHNRVTISGLYLNQWTYAAEPPLYAFIPLHKPDVSEPIKKRNATKPIRNAIDTRDVPPKILNFLNNRGDVCVKIVQSCNGLLCCSYSELRENESGWIGNRGTETKSYYIYNPTTKSYKVVPESPFRKDGCRSVRSMNLAFDPLKSPDYEVICFSKNDEKNAQIEIYSSKTSSWKLCEAVFEGQISESEFTSIVTDNTGVFWNGSLHWISEGGTAAHLDIGRGLVKEMLMLPDCNDDSDSDDDEEEEGSDNDEDEDSDTDEDEDTNKWKWDSASVLYFGENGGHLYLVRIFYPHWRIRFEILELKSDYTGWNVKYRGSFRKMTRQYPELLQQKNWIEHDFFGVDFSILLVEETEESLKMVIRIVDRVVSYDLTNKSFKGSCNSGRSLSVSAISRL